MLLRGRGFDVTSAHEVGTSGWTDEQQLQYAIDDRRLIFTYNVRHFQQLALEATAEHQHHFGILVSYAQYNRNAVGSLADRLAGFLRARDASEMDDSFAVLGSG